ncbi:flippase [Egbenema bharatensis]|uniref:flippase n=1 Tax=Egbenema bharatensis TaxID=3463334 RepID=UPI003A8925DE
MIKQLHQLGTKLSFSQRRVLGNIAWLFTDRFLQMGLALFVGLWVARYLGPDRFGSLNYAMSFVSLFGIIASLGLDSIVVRDVVRYPDAKHEILGTAFLLKLIGGLVSIPAVIWVNSLLRPDEPMMQWLVAIVAVGGIFNAFNIISFWFQAQVNSKYSVIVRNTAYIMTCGIRIALISFEAPLIAFAVALLIEMILGGLGLLISYQWKERDFHRWSQSMQRARSLLRDSFPMIITGAVTVIYMRTDSVMLGQMANDRLVGLYAAVMKLAEMWYFVPGAITGTVFPLVIKLKEQNETLYYERAQQLFTLMAGLSYLVAIPISLFSSQLMFIFYGEDYVEGGNVLAIYVWAGLFVSLGVARGPWMVAGDLLNFRATAAAAGAVINVALNWVLIPRIGIMGATIATLISQCISCYLANAFHPKARELFIRQTKGIFLFGLPQLMHRFWRKGKLI